MTPQNLHNKWVLRSIHTFALSAVIWEIQIPPNIGHMILLSYVRANIVNIASHIGKIIQGKHNKPTLLYP